MDSIFLTVLKNTLQAMKTDLQRCSKTLKNETLPHFWNFTQAVRGQTFVIILCNGILSIFQLYFFTATILDYKSQPSSSSFQVLYFSYALPQHLNTIFNKLYLIIRLYYGVMELLLSILKTQENGFHVYFAYHFICAL